MNNIVILKVLIHELTLVSWSRALDVVNDHGINLDKIYVTLTKDKADNTCIEDIRTRNLRMSLVLTCGLR